MSAAESWNTCETHDIKSSLISSNILGCEFKNSKHKSNFNFLKIIKGQFTDLLFTVYKLQICFNAVHAVFMLFCAVHLQQIFQLKYHFNDMGGRNFGLILIWRMHSSCQPKLWQSCLGQFCVTHGTAPQWAEWSNTFSKVAFPKQQLY